MSRSPITAETTPEVNKPTAPMARMPATIFRLTFSANANATAPRKTTADIITAIQIAHDFDTVKKIREAQRTATAIPTVPKTGTSIGFINRFLSSAFAIGSPVALSDQALIISSNAVVMRIINPTVKIAECVTRPITSVPRPKAPIAGQ